MSGGCWRPCLTVAVVAACCFDFADAFNILHTRYAASVACLLPYLFALCLFADHFILFQLRHHRTKPCTVFEADTRHHTIPPHTKLARLPQRPWFGVRLLLLLLLLLLPLLHTLS